MKRRIAAICLSCAMAFSLSAAAGCSSGSNNSLVGSVNRTVGNVSAADAEMQKTNAAALSNSCKAYYASVVSGTVCAENPGAVTADKLPSMTDPVSKKKGAALMLTVGGAIQYGGLGYVKDMLNSFVADSKTGVIYAIIDDNKPSTATVQVTEDTTLHQLGYS